MQQQPVGRPCIIANGFHQWQTCSFYRTKAFGPPGFRSIIYPKNDKRVAERKNGRNERFNLIAADGKFAYQPWQTELEMKVTPKRAENNPYKVLFGTQDQMQSIFQSIIDEFLRMVDDFMGGCLRHRLV